MPRCPRSACGSRRRRGARRRSRRSGSGARRRHRRRRRCRRRDVASVSRSIPIKPRGVTSTPSSGCSQDRSGAWPIARITESHSMTFSVPPMNCGLNRPSGSKTEETSSVWSPVTEPLPRIACGPRRVMISMPSTSASSISNSCAGISCRFSSATTRTRRAPIRLATRATSNVAVAAAPASSISSVVRRLGRCRPRRSRGAPCARRRAPRSPRRSPGRPRPAPRGSRGSR